jgi:hypothetical protein
MPKAKKIPTPTVACSVVKFSVPQIQAVVFELRELIRTPKELWTAEQKQWWGKLNVALGLLESKLENQK